MNLQEEKKEYPFEFSILMPIYNVEAYICEAIDSIIEQDIGFEKNVQLVLVDDGSPDRCGEICDEYAKKYPRNIVVVHKQNAGVSEARNTGIQYLEGRFAGFLDPDDKYSLNTLSSVSEFFSKHEEETDIVSIPLVFFEGMTGRHILNYKYDNGSRVIDLEEEYKCVQFSLASAFVPTDVIKNIHFDSSLVVGEDSKAILEILERKMTLGVVSEATYYYRKRIAEVNSLTQTAEKKPGRYLVCMERFAEYAIEYYLKKRKRVPRFVQYTLMYDLQWRLQQKTVPEGVLTEAEIEEYRNKVYRLLTYIGDDIIDEQKALNPTLKRFAREKKYFSGEVYTSAFKDYFYSALYRSKGLGQTLDFFELDNGVAKIEGRVSVSSVVPRDVKVWAIINGKRKKCSVEIIPSQVMFVGEPCLVQYKFSVDVNIEDTVERYSVKFMCSLDGEKISFAHMSCTQYFPFGMDYKASYFYKDNRKMTLSKGTITIDKCGRKGRISSEYRLIREMWKFKKQGARKAAVARVLVLLASAFKKKKIWLISDRKNKAGDNGEALFRYLREIRPSNIRPVFVINKSSNDFSRMKKIGEVIDGNTWRYKLLFLFSDIIISAQADHSTTNPFANYWWNYRDIIRTKKFVFLQHGVIQNDISDWLNRYSKNISGFVTSAHPEYLSILNNQSYQYDENTVWLTGLPRHDRLYHAEEKSIVICPTWRQYLMSHIDEKTGIWQAKPNYENSEYVSFYRNLLNDKRLLAAAKKLNYKIVFHPHPNAMAYKDLFNANDQIIVGSIEEEYPDIIAKNKLLVTDYSSVAMDFAYTRKPIIYCQFDFQTFYGGSHVCKEGYFNYETDGFGEVETSLDGTVDRIIEYMENDCYLKPQYRERIGRFFAFDDKSNCERVYQKMLKL